MFLEFSYCQFLGEHNKESLPCIWNWWFSKTQFPNQIPKLAANSSLPIDSRNIPWTLPSRNGKWTKTSHWPTGQMLFGEVVLNFHFGFKDLLLGRGHVLGIILFWWKNNCRVLVFFKSLFYRLFHAHIFVLKSTQSCLYLTNTIWWSIFHFKHLA